jgi:hypothetical protein
MVIPGWQCRQQGKYKSSAVIRSYLWLNKEGSFILDIKDIGSLFPFKNWLTIVREVVNIRP